MIESCDVAGHVVQTPRIRFPLPDLVRLFVGVAVEPGMVVEPTGLGAEVERRVRVGAVGVLSLGFRRQATGRG